jgi:acyl-CoA thioesterase-2
MSFLLPGDTTVPIDFEVTAVRDGGSISARRVEARQHDRAIFTMAASYQAHAAGPEHQPERHDVPAPLDAPSPAELFASDPANRAWADGLADFLDVELRFPYPPARAPATRGEAAPPRQRVWARTHQGIGDEPVLRDAGVAYLSDMLLLATALGPHRMTLQDERITFATINHTIWFHTPLQVDEWFRYDQESRWAGRGRALCHGEMYDGAGQLCATTMQEGLVRYR